MNEQSVLATAMLAISFSALLLLMGLEQGAKRDRDFSVALTRQADVREGLEHSARQRTQSLHEVRALEAGLLAPGTCSVPCC